MLRCFRRLPPMCKVHYRTLERSTDRRAYAALSAARDAWPMGSTKYQTLARERLAAMTRLLIRVSAVIVIWSMYGLLSIDNSSRHGAEMTEFYTSSRMFQIYPHRKVRPPGIVLEDEHTHPSNPICTDQFWKLHHCRSNLLLMGLT